MDAWKTIDNYTYHPYSVTSPRDIPVSILKKLRDNGKISERKEIVMEAFLFGNKETFAIDCKMFQETGETEIAIYINNKNILEFRRNGNTLTTRWVLDDLAEWLRDFINNMSEDPYPIDCCGKYAAQKDIEAREFDSDDDEFDAYYDKLYEWNLKHRWHPTSNGAILADVYFQLNEGFIEISWNNQDAEDGVVFSEILGGASIPRNEFVKVVEAFLNCYADYWF